MKTYIEVNGERYEATITGRVRDKEWGDRESKSIRIKMDYFDARDLFVENMEWAILCEHEVEKQIEDEDGNITTEIVIEYDRYENGVFSMVGDLTDHRNGYVTVKMGKPTAEELLAILSEVL